VAKRQEIAQLKSERVVEKQPASLGEQAFISTAAFSQDDYGQVLVGTSDGIVALWTNWKQGEDALRIIGRHAKGVAKVLDSTFGRMTASLSDNGGLLFYAGPSKRTVTAGELRALDDTNNIPGEIDAVFSANGDRFVTCPRGHPLSNLAARVWRTADGTLIEEIRAAQPSFSPNQASDIALATAGFIGGRPVVAIAQDRGRVRFSDGASPPPHDSSVLLKSVFSPDDAMFIGSSENGAIKIWRKTVGLSEDWSTRPELLVGHSESISELLLRPNVQRLMSVSRDGSIRVWSTSATLPAAGQSTKDNREPKVSAIGPAMNERLRAIGRSREAAPRCLTRQQRQAFLLPPEPPLWCVERRLWPYHGDERQARLAAKKSLLSEGRSNQR
jgi:WD40 repeat protein